MAIQKVSYQKLNEELEAILAELQQVDLDVDAAAKAYSRGKEIIEQLEAYLKSAENTVEKVKQKARS